MKPRSLFVFLLVAAVALSVCSAAAEESRDDEGYEGANGNGEAPNAEADDVQPLEGDANANNDADGDRMVGGKLKGHLCLGSAGYVWCEAKNRCLRLWEEECAGWEQQEKKY